MKTGSPPRIRALGRSLKVLERIATIGALMGLDRSSSYRMARREAWPMVGSAASGWVLTMQVLDRYGIEYRLESDDPAELRAIARDGAAAVSADSSRTIESDGETHARDARG